MGGELPPRSSWATAKDLARCNTKCCFGKDSSGRISLECSIFSLQSTLSSFAFRWLLKIPQNLGGFFSSWHTSTSRWKSWQSWDLDSWRHSRQPNSCGATCSFGMTTSPALRTLKALKLSKQQLQAFQSIFQNALYSLLFVQRLKAWRRVRP